MMIVFEGFLWLGRPLVDRKCTTSYSDCVQNQILGNVCMLGKNVCKYILGGFQTGHPNIQ